MNNVSKFAFDEAATAVDKARWLEARTMIYTKEPDFIKAWIMNITDEEYREDMRRRFNVIKGNLPKRKNGRK